MHVKEDKRGRGFTAVPLYVTASPASVLSTLMISLQLTLGPNYDLSI